MTRRFLTLFLITLPLLIASATAQPPDTLWTARWGTIEYDYEKFECVNAVTSGGYIACGHVYGPEYGIQAATYRLDDDGNEIWSNLDGLTGSDFAHYIEPTSDGGFIECGETWSYPIGLQCDAFVRKLDADGNQIWARLYGENSFDYFNCVREVPAGGYIAVGGAGGYSLYRLSQSGEVIWRRSSPANTYTPLWVEPTADGGFVVPTRRDNFYHSLFKLNRHGQLEWVNDETIPGELHDGLGMCVREDEDGYLYTSGRIILSLRTRYVSKRNPDGSLIWGLTFADFPNQQGEVPELTLLADGNIAVAGFFLDEDYFVHMWLAKFNPDGEVLWEYEQLGGDLASVAQGRDGGIVAAWYPRENLLDDSEDMALIKWEPEVTITLQPSEVTVPSGGGWLTFDAEVNNILLDPTPLQAWVRVVGPDGGSTLRQQLGVTLQPGGNFSAQDISIYVPAGAPDGEYTYEINLGDAPHPLANMGYGAFTFEKGTGTSVPDGSGWPQDDDTLGLLFGGGSGGASGTSAHVSESGKIVLLAATPNPFNSSTSIQVALSRPAELTVTVYNIRGQRVTILADRRLTAGQHTFPFDANLFASGLYVIRAQVPGHLDQVQKVMLVR